VLVRGRTDAVSGEQPLQFAGTAPVEAEFDLRGNRGREKTGAHRQLHVHQDIELAAAHRGAQGAIRLELATLIDGNELDIRDVAEQFRFDAPDHPGEAGLGPGTLQCANDRQHMTGIADGGQPQNADRTRCTREIGGHQKGADGGRSRGISIRSRTTDGEAGS
jgi:hypothetical protein